MDPVTVLSVLNSTVGQVAGEAAAVGITGKDLIQAGSLIGMPDKSF